MRYPHIALIIAASALVLSGCSAAAPTAPDDAVTDPNASDTTTDDTATGGGVFSIDHITSCDQVEAVVAPYIEGLAPMASNGVDEWSVYCGWETAEGETDWANVRSVDITLTPLGTDESAPDTSWVETMDGAEVLTDAWLDTHGGVATSVTIGTAVTGVASTTVWVPGVEVMISGGTWADYPDLDGPASIEIAKALVKK